jgi:hypothetical protein
MKKNPCDKCSQTCNLIGAPEYSYFVEKEKRKCPCRTCLIRPKCSETCELRRGHIRWLWRLVHESKGYYIKPEMDKENE